MREFHVDTETIFLDTDVRYIHMCTYTELLIVIEG
jgi:hypothetical protein